MQTRNQRNQVTVDQVGTEMSFSPSMPAKKTGHQKGGLDRATPMSTSNRTTSTKYSPRPPTRQALDPHGLGIHKGGWEKDNGRTPALNETLQSSSSVSRRHSVVGWVGVSGSGKIQVIDIPRRGQRSTQLCSCPHSRDGVGPSSGPADPG